MGKGKGGGKGHHGHGHHHHHHMMHHMMGKGKGGHPEDPEHHHHMHMMGKGKGKGHHHGKGHGKGKGKGFPGFCDFFAPPPPEAEIEPKAAKEKGQEASCKSEASTAKLKSTGTTEGDNAAVATPVADTDADQ